MLVKNETFFFFSCLIIKHFTNNFTTYIFFTQQVFDRFLLHEFLKIYINIRDYKIKHINIKSF